MSKIRKPTVELDTAAAARPSRIRREPPPPAGQSLLKQLSVGGDPERDQWTVILGVLMFGITITFLILFFSDYTSH